MDGPEPFYGPQYPPLGPCQPAAPAAVEESDLDAMPLDAGPDSVNGSDRTDMGHTLDEMVSQNHRELQRRRRSMQPQYIQNQGADLTQASIMDYSGNGISGLPLDPTQSADVLAGNVSDIMGPLQGDMDFSKQHPSREDLALDTQFSNISSAYESMSSATSYHSSLDLGSSVGFDLSAAYNTPTIGPHIDLNHSGLTNPAVGVPQPINIYQQPDYLSAQHQPASNGGYSALQTTTQDLGTGMVQTQTPSEKSIKREDDLIRCALGQDLHNPVARNGSEITMQNNPPAFRGSQPSNSIRQPHTSQPSITQSSIVPTAAADPDKVIGNTTTLPYPLPDLRKVKSESSDKNSTTGLDAYDILSRVTARPNPKIPISAADITCAFVVCDLNASDDPIVYVSDNFERLTGYSKREVLGRNCRFLQAPDGNVDAGAERKCVDRQATFHLKSKIETRSESQVGLINYRKGGQPFINLLTMIPIRWDSEEYKYCVGFQVDLVEKPQAVCKINSDGSYMVNYKRDQLPRYVHHPPEKRKPPLEISQPASHKDFLTFPDKVNTCEFTKSSWEKMFLEQSDDVVHVLSPKGQFLYLSPSTSKVLEYDVNELVGTSISSICHPSDIVSLTRELRESTPNSTVNVIYRIRKKYGGYIWFESHGSLHIESGTGRKCLILAGRERPTYDLTRNDILEAGGMSETELWTKLSSSGMFLFVSSNVRKLLDRLPNDLIGKSMSEYMNADSKIELQGALKSSRKGERATFRHELLHKRGHVLSMETVLYPAGANGRSKPAFLIAQTRLLKLTRAFLNPVRKTPQALSPEVRSGSATPATLTNPFGGLRSSQFGVSPCPTPTTPLNPHLSGFADQVDLEESLFEELKPTRGTSWQSQVRKTEKGNRRSHDEFNSLQNRKRKRKRKKGTGPLEKYCAVCYTRDTPEWRRGPSGNRDLCNGCGLRYAKQNGRISPRKNSEPGDKTPSNSSQKPSPTSEISADNATQDMRLPKG